MNLLNIFSEIEKIDSDAPERFEFTRRKMLKTTTASLAGTSAFVLSTINKAFASEADIRDALNFALLLEYLEFDFYEKALASPNLIPPSDRELFTRIADDEERHVQFLRMALGSFAIAKPNFDFTAGGMYPTVFSVYNTFLTLSQTFEDLGVRAYKGQAPRLKENRDVLLSALRIHSVEARHAGEVRLVRGLRVWPSEDQLGGAPPAVYAGGNNIAQLGINLVPISAPQMIQRDLPKATLIVGEAFDEPLTKEQVLALAMPFVK